MIVKLKCIDNADYRYFTKGCEYRAKTVMGDSCFILYDDDGIQCVVSAVSDFHGKWEVVKDDC